MGFTQTYDSGSEINISFPAIDLILGKSYVTLLAGIVTTSKFLRTFTFDSDSAGVYDTGTCAEGGEVDGVDNDFDIEFGENRTIEGEAIINGTLVLGKAPATGGNVGFWKIEVLIRKWDGSTETEIASATTTELQPTITAADSPFPFKWGVNIDIPKTTIKKGESLRITTLFKSRNWTSPAPDFTFPHSPSNQAYDDVAGVDYLDWGSIGSVLKCFIPFKVPR